MLDKFDKRIVQRLIKKGVLAKKEYHDNLKNLPDLTNSCILEDTVPVTVEGKTKIQNVEEIKVITIETNKSAKKNKIKKNQ